MDAEELEPVEEHRDVTARDDHRVGLGDHRGGLVVERLHFRVLDRLRHPRKGDAHVAERREHLIVDVAHRIDRPDELAVHEIGDLVAMLEEPLDDAERAPHADPVQVLVRAHALRPLAVRARDPRRPP